MSNTNNNPLGGPNVANGAGLNNQGRLDRMGRSATRIGSRMVKAISAFRSHMRKNYSLLIAISAGVFSLVTTAAGISSLAYETSPFLATVGGFMASGFISIAIFVFYRALMVGQYTSVRSKIFFGVLALVASLASAVLASGVTSFVMNSDSYQTDMQEGGLAAMVTPLATLREVASSRSSELKSFSTRMSRLSAVESQQGGTCGPSVGATCGPRCRMRKRKSEEAQFHAGEVAAVAQVAVEVVSDTGSALTAEEWGGLYRRSALAANDPRIDNARDWAVQTREDFRNGFFDEETGSSFICVDAPTERALESLISEFEEDIGFPDAPPAHQVPNFADAVGTNLATIGDMLMSMIGGSDGYNKEAADRMMGPLVFSLMVEAFVVGGLYTHISEQRGRNGSGGSNTGGGNDGRGGVPPTKWFALENHRIPDQQVPKARKLLKLVLDHSIDDVGAVDRKGRFEPQRYLFIPVGLGKNRRGLEWVRQELDFRPHELWPGGADVARMPAPAREQVEKHYPAAKQVMFFPYGPHQNKMLSRLVRSLETG